MASAASNHINSYHAFAINGKENGAVIELPLREPAADEVRVRVAYVGVCGSDLHYYFHGANGSFVIQEPLIPGHEVSGVIDFDPKGEFVSGTPVAIFPAQPGTPIDGLEDRPHLWHGVRYLGSAAMTPHTQGALSEFLFIKRSMVRPLPQGISLKAGALAEPLAVAIHGVRLAGNVNGKRVLISGSGPIGLLAIVAAKSAGADYVAATDLFDEALSRAKEVGADEVINVQTGEIPKDSFEVVIECSGSIRALNSAITSIKRGGVIVQVGMIGSGDIPVDIGLVVTKELRLLGAFRFNDEMERALELLQSRPELEKCISHIFQLRESVQAFEMSKDAQKSGKVLIAL